MHHRGLQGTASGEKQLCGMITLEKEDNPLSLKLVIPSPGLLLLVLILEETENGERLVGKSQSAQLMFRLVRQFMCL